MVDLPRLVRPMMANLRHELPADEDRYPRDHKVIGDNGTYRANAPTDSSMSRSLTTR